MFELRPFERRNNHVAAYDPWDQMERAFFGDGSWGRGLSEFKTDIQDKGDFYLLEADLPGFKKEDIHVDATAPTRNPSTAYRSKAVVKTTRVRVGSIRESSMPLSSGIWISQKSRSTGSVFRASSAVMPPL